MAKSAAEVMPPTEPSAAESRASRVLNLDVEDEQYMAYMAWPTASPPRNGWMFLFWNFRRIMVFGTWVRTYN